jgi:acyl carrier protein
MDLEPIRDYICRRLLRPGAPLPGDEAPLFSNGLIDSFGVLELITFLEERYGINIDTTRHEILEFDTVLKIARVVTEEGGDLAHA